MGVKHGLAAAVCTAVANVGPVPVTVSAAAFAYQLTVSESASTMVYGELSPSFQAHLTPPADDPPLGGGGIPFYFTVDSMRFGGSLSYDHGSYALYLGSLGTPSPSVGQHTVVANYQ